MKFYPLIIGLILSCTTAASSDCIDLIERYDLHFRLMHLTAAEQRIVLIQSDNNVHLLDAGETLFNEWLLEQVLVDRTVFVCNSNKAVKIIVHKFDASSPRSPDVIDIYQAQPVYNGLDQ